MKSTLEEYYQVNSLLTRLLLRQRCTLGLWTPWRWPMRASYCLALPCTSDIIRLIQAFPTSIKIKCTAGILVKPGLFCYNLSDLEVDIVWVVWLERMILLQERHFMLANYIAPLYNYQHVLIIHWQLWGLRLILHNNRWLASTKRYDSGIVSKLRAVIVFVASSYKPDIFV